MEKKAADNSNVYSITHAVSVIGLPWFNPNLKYPRGRRESQGSGRLRRFFFKSRTVLAVTERLNFEVENSDAPPPRTFVVWIIDCERAGEKRLRSQSKTDPNTDVFFDLNYFARENR